VLRTTKLRELHLRYPPQPGRPSHLSAASGLVRVADLLYVVADDELHLGVFPASGDAPGELLRLKKGELSDAPAQRKANKPDLESLTLLPRCEQYPAGALMALGSGSSSRRNDAFIVTLSEQGAALGVPQRVSLTAMFAAIATQIEDINIEGAAVSDTRLRLLQRGNKGKGRSAIIDVDLPSLLRALQGEPVAPAIDAISSYDLGAVDNVPLTFSDGVTLADGSLLFTAIAEDTTDSYADGQCVGAAIGIINAKGLVQTLQPLEQPLKIEGVVATEQGATIKLLLVTDADNASVPASLYSAEFTR
jgi:hypothetical protein